MDVDARAQFFDFKTTYQFQTTPGISNYNMPLYAAQTEPGAQVIAPFPVYQGFFSPCFANGIEIPFYNQRDAFWKIWPNYIQALPSVAIGDGSTTTFQFTLPFFPAIPGYLDMSGIVYSGSTTDPIFTNAFPLNSNGNINLPSTSIYPGVFLTYVDNNGSNTVVTDSGVYLNNNTTGDLYGLLLHSGSAPFGNSPLGSNTYSVTQNTVNYTTGLVNVTFPTAPLAQSPIQAQCYFYQQGLPRAVLFYNNCITIRPPPNTQYLMELGAYLTPAAFLSGAQAVPFGYMSEYIARGAARKILSDTGDWEQFNAYEQLFLEQERLVWKRSQRIFTATRTGTIFSDLSGPQSPNSIGQGAT
jgi:hypothetical protein